MILRRLIFLVSLLGIYGGVLPVFSGSSSAIAGDWVQLPKPPKGKGKKCVADTDFMRRNHMKMLLHQRDDTMRSGIRTKRFSLKECITCHAVNGADNKPVTVKSPKHFCRQCHDYVAVRLDCFECHASRPEPTGGKAAFLSGSPEKKQAMSRAHGDGDARDVAALKGFLRSAQQ